MTIKEIYKPLFPLNSYVIVIGISRKTKGYIKGYAFKENNVGYIIELDEGFWGKNEDIFVSTLYADISNVKMTNDEE